VFNNCPHLTALILLISSFFVGGVVGFYKGYFSGHASEALESSPSTMIALSELHKNDIKQALATLDQHLDGQVIVGVKLSEHSMFDLMGFANSKLNKNFITAIAKHRMAYPRTNAKEPNSEEKNVQQVVDATLQRAL